MITCSLTGAKGKGVKAHIVPRAFYKLPSQDSRVLRLISNVEGHFPKKVPVGIYDSSIVTIEGERILGAWDNYAVKILIDGLDAFEEIEIDGSLRAWKLSEYNYVLLKLFALSVLWRAHISQHPAFSKVQLGPHEAAIRKMLLSSEPGRPEQYSANIVRWNSPDFGPLFMDPLFEKYQGVNYYRVYCGEYILYIKIDKRSTIKEFEEFQLGYRQELFMIARELSKSNEWPIMQRIAKSVGPGFPSK